ncbi:hypothetical protein BN1263110041 [Stenotrophomonas indicatrix]|nr:hypothetical protein BN1263110041 [Stenotrophomonas indicatrix]
MWGSEKDIGRIPAAMANIHFTVLGKCRLHSGPPLLKVCACMHSRDREWTLAAPRCHRRKPLNWR